MTFQNLLVVSGALIALAFSAGCPAASDPEPTTKLAPEVSSPQEVPPGQQPKVDTVKAPVLTGVPKLTGNKAKDKAALLLALEQAGSEEASVKASLDALLKRTKNKPSDQELAPLQARHDAVRQRVAAIQDLLDKVRAAGDRQ